MPSSEFLEPLFGDLGFIVTSFLDRGTHVLEHYQKFVKILMKFWTRYDEIGGILVPKNTEYFDV